MQIVQSNGVDLAMLEMGSGRPTVFVHGLAFGSMALWYMTGAMQLTDQCRVVLYDQRGHGNSGITESGFDLETQSNDLDAVVQACADSSQQIDLVGHSMGGLIALNYALKKPERIRRLVLVDSGVPASKYILPSLLAIHSEQVLNDYLNSPHAIHPGLKGRRRERVYQRLKRLFFESSMVRDVQAMPAPSEAEMGGLRVPTLLVYGRFSESVAAGEYLMNWLPNASLSLLECGHRITREAPEALFAEIRRFLCQHSA